MAPSAGLEPAYRIRYGLHVINSHASYQLEYKGIDLVDPVGFEPTHP